MAPSFPLSCFFTLLPLYNVSAVIRVVQFSSRPVKTVWLWNFHVISAFWKNWQKSGVREIPLGYLPGVQSGSRPNCIINPLIPVLWSDIHTNLIISIGVSNRPTAFLSNCALLFKNRQGLFGSVPGVGIDLRGYEPLKICLTDCGT